MQEAVKKSAIQGEYIISEKQSGSIEVFRIYDNTKGALREVSEKIGFAYDSDWTTRQFGSKLIDHLNEGTNVKDVVLPKDVKKAAYYGEYSIQCRMNGSIEVFRTYDNTKGALREVSEKIGFAYDSDWTTRQFGSKLINHLND